MIGNQPGNHSEFTESLEGVLFPPHHHDIKKDEHGDQEIPV
jgi:hypothetical protein